jgi:diguanylate cyclase (GGDEF)-like protein
MSWRVCVRWFEHLPVRSILLTALLALGGWGTFTAITEVSKAYEAYRQSQNIIVWAHTTNHLFRMAQHFAFERGRTAVVLRDTLPISAANQNFLRERRAEADEAMQDFLRDRHLLPNVGQEALVRQWEEVQALRQKIDKDIALPLSQRDPQLADQWFGSATQFLSDSRKLAQLLISSYVRNRGLELARLTLVASYAFELRLIVGAEAAQIAQHMAGGKPMGIQTLARIYEMRGQEQMVWEEINRLRRYAPIPNLDPAIDAAWKKHHDVLQPQQNAALMAWAQERAPERSLQALISAAQPALDGISELMQLASTEIEQLALKHRQQALQALLRSLAVGSAILAIMSLAIWYVIRKVIKPLEALDQSLRGLIDESSNPSAKHAHNEIACLEEATELVTHLWQEKSRLEGELRNLAFQDSLTQLPNRRLLMERIQQARIKNDRRHLYACLLFLDLDKFKQINDSHGHDLGDQLLIAVGARLKSLLRGEDTVARLGGDEFIVLIEDLGSDEAEAHKSTAALCDKLKRELAEPYTLDGVSLRCSVSIGCKLFYGSKEDVHALIRAADAAMYQCKNEREGGFVEITRTDT